MEPALGWDPIGKPEGVALGVVADVGRITPYGEAAEYGEFSDRAARYEAAGRGVCSCWIGELYGT
jgi:hypothetical protein